MQKLGPFQVGTLKQKKKDAAGKKVQTFENFETTFEEIAILTRKG